MGRHSRKGPAPAARGGDRTTGSVAPGTGRRRRAAAPEAQERPQPAPPPYGTGSGPGYGTPPYGTPAYGTPGVRGGHPEQREPGGGWGTAPYAGPGARQAGAGPYGGAGPYPDPAAGPQRRIAQGPPRVTQPGAYGQEAARVPGPRREFVEAFDSAADGMPPGAGPATASAAGEPVGEPIGDAGAGAGAGAGADADGRRTRGGKGRTYTGIAAAAVTTVLAVVVAGQVTDAGRQDDRAARAADAPERDAGEELPSRSDRRATPPQGLPSAPARPVTYGELMARQFPLNAKLKGSGEFEAVPGLDEAPGKGRKIRYRVDVEKGLGLDGRLFAQAVQQTLNDDRSWAHGGAMTFERVSSGDPDFVITLASPGTTGVWCAKSGLDTTIDNVSCDSASTERVMINAYRWAQGAETFGPDAMLPYRQMLINHEVGHRLGHNHVSCKTPGALAPVMQQQTKTLEIDGVKCRPNPWVYPGD
ncbi:DUF3152 domain-containing protein [Streptomyces coeruleoprunus]|uniref:DUF3152 domain-containing protein n=1 Tax=Streptomyces coeruleoprunus TaxID=285563 RepID=A0ABV9XNL9_9ACTN